MARDPLTDEQRLRIRELADRGMSARAIGREVGCHFTTAAQVCRDAGETLANRRLAHVEKLIAVKRADGELSSVALRRRRQEVQLEQLETAQLSYQRARQAYTYMFPMQVGPRAGEIVERVMPVPQAREFNDFAKAGAGAANVACRLAEMDADPVALAGAQSLLGSLCAALAVKADDLDMGGGYEQDGARAQGAVPVIEGGVLGEGP